MRKITLVALLRMDLKGDQEILQLQGMAQGNNMAFLHINSFMQTKLPLYKLGQHLECIWTTGPLSKPVNMLKTD